VVSAMGDQQSKPGEVPALGAVQLGSGDVAAGTAAELPQVNGVQGDGLKNEAPSALLGDGSEGEASAQESKVPSESEILAKLVTHLSQCENHRTPLADIRARLPPHLQKLTEDTQAIVDWLGRFKGLIEIVGEPGNEEVVFLLGGASKAPSGGAPVGKPAKPQGGAPAAAPRPAPSALVPVRGDVLHSQPVAIAYTGTDLADDEVLSACTVQLRGLPFRAQVNEIKAFLGDHVAFLSTKEPAIRLLLNRDGRPSGFARVQFTTPEAARACREALHKQVLGDRYVEVLACSDRAGKARHRRAVATEAQSENPCEVAGWSGGGELVLDSATEAVERERVLQECRDHMRTPGRQQLLLSMLGIALSPQARTYLRRLNLGLKHFLARFPHEFRVEGPKGCEQVYWCPNGMAPTGMEFSMLGQDAMLEQVAAMTAAWNASLVCEMPPSVTTNPSLLASPTPHKSHHAHLMDTPSDWGTPGPLAMQSAPQAAMDSSAAQSAGSAPAGSVDSANPFAGGNPYAFGWPPAWAGGGWPGAWPPQDMGDFDGKGAGKGQKQRAGAKTDAPAARSHAHLHPQNNPFAHKPPSLGAAGTSVQPSASATAGSASEAEYLNSNVAAVRLRGLPFSMSVQDVLAFFAQHDVADRIADGPQAAQLLPKANGRPSGQARVQMRTRYDAEVAQQALHNQWIGGRYIEVFVYGEETEQQANDFNAQLGFPAEPKASAGAGPAVQALSGFPGFSPLGLPGVFPGGFPAAPPVWTGMPLVMPQLGMPQPGMPGQGVPNPDLDTLFSFLYQDQAAEQSNEGADGASRTDQSQRNAVQV